jgi:hypothetical protein
MQHDSVIASRGQGRRIDQAGAVDACAAECGRRTINGGKRKLLLNPNGRLVAVISTNTFVPQRGAEGEAAN